MQSLLRSSSPADTINSTAEEEEEEDVQGMKQEIRRMKQEDVSSTRNALRLAAQAEASGQQTCQSFSAKNYDDLQKLTKLQWNASAPRANASTTPKGIWIWLPTRTDLPRTRPKSLRRSTRACSQVSSDCNR
jgi:hypothetical protein